MPGFSCRQILTPSSTHLKVHLDETPHSALNNAERWKTESATEHKQKHAQPTKLERPSQPTSSCQWVQHVCSCFLARWPVDLPCNIQESWLKDANCHFLLRPHAGLLLFSRGDHGRQLASRTATDPSNSFSEFFKSEITTAKHCLIVVK